MDVDARIGFLMRIRKAAVVVALGLLLGATLFLVYRGPDFATLAGFGYPGVAILMFLSSTTIILPAPGFAAVVAAGAVWNPLLVGIAAAVGAATGELSGYLLGVGGGAVVRPKMGSSWKRAQWWLEKYGFWTILVVAAVPNPFFDVIGLVAGSLSYPVKRFWLACMLGKTIKYVVLAYLGNSATCWWVES